MRVKEKQINILGTMWRIVSRSEKEDSRLENSSGLTDTSCRTIVLTDANIEEYTIREPMRDIQRTLRHEIIHAFLFESGLWCNSGLSENWAMNEEMVDWLAIQFPKMYDVMVEAKALPWSKLEMEE